MSSLPLPRRDDLDPYSWKPAGGVDQNGRPEPGDLVGVLYAAWRVLEVNPVADVDLDDDERDRLTLYLPEYQDEHRPYHLVLRHEVGPILEKLKRLHDGSKVGHIRVFPMSLSSHLRVLPDRYMTCSCHGHPWPCQDVDRDRHSAKAAARLDRLLLTATPGMCASCLEPITQRQKSLTFPEPYLLVPGAPGPTFHAERAACWWDAREYEVNHRLRALPGVARVASCPGHAFAHVNGGELDCSEGAMCTGHHGPQPRGRRRLQGDCYTHYVRDTLEEHRPPRPVNDCGYRHPTRAGVACLGATVS